MHHARWFFNLILVVLMFFLAGCSHNDVKPATTIAVTDTLEPPTATSTPIPPTLTNTPITPTATHTKRPEIFPVPGKWIGEGDNSLAVTFKIISDNNTFTIVRDFRYSNLSIRCGKQTYTSMVPAAKDFMLADGEFSDGYGQFGEVRAPNRIEGLVKFFINDCGGIVEIKWIAHPVPSPTPTP